MLSALFNRYINFNSYISNITLKQDILIEISTDWIHNLTKNEIRREFACKNLKTKGQISELKARLFKYLKR